MTRREFNRHSLAAAAAFMLPRLVRAAQPPPSMNAVDTHAHIFRRDLPMVAGRRYTPDYDVTAENFLQQLDAHGIARGVLIQPSFLGTNNSYLLDALRRYPQRLRGVAVVDPTVSEDVLAEFAATGVVGLRLNLVGLTLPDFSAEPWPKLLRRVAKLDWHIEIHREAKDVPAILGSLLKAGVKVVVDHFGRPDPALGIKDPGFQGLLKFGESRRVWVKLSGAYRNGAEGRGEAIASAAVPLLRGAFGPAGLVWASDWPHTQFEKTANYAAVRAQFDTWITDPAEHTAILCDTPAKLFHFV